MPATNAWDETKPAGTDLASTIDNQMRAMKLDIRERLALEHYWHATLATDGKHKEITITPATVNVALIFASMQQITGADSTEAVIIQSTWNTTGTPTMLGMYTTDTASDPASLFINCKLNGASKFKVSKNGVVIAASFLGDASAVTGILETAIVNGAILARVADAEVITGKWTIAASTGVVIASGVPAVTSNTLYSNGGALFFNGAGLATGSSVSGTTGRIAKFTSPTSIGDSVIVEAGGIITAAPNVPLLNAARNTYAGLANYGTSTALSSNGDIGYNSTWGSYWLAKAGATNDFTIFDSLGNPTVSIPTGTRNWTVGANIIASGPGPHTFGTGTTAVANAIIRLNAGSGAGGGAFIQGQKNGVTTWDIGDRSAVTGAGTSGDLMLFTEAGNSIAFATGGSVAPRWGIDPTGGFTGRTGNVFINGSTVSCFSGDCAGGVVGSPSAFRITAQGTTNAAVINFGVAFTSTPICVCGAHNSMAVWSPGPFTNQVTISWATVSAATIWCHCFGTM